MTRPRVVLAAFTLGLAVTTVLAVVDDDTPDLGNGLYVHAGARQADSLPDVRAWVAGVLHGQEKPYTTTTRPPEVRRRLFRAALDAEAGYVNGYPCGGVDLPPCRVLRRESNGDPRVWNNAYGCDGPVYYPSGYAGSNPCGSTASGLWQALRSTWAGYGGYLNAADAPPEVQNAFARELWAGGKGAHHWKASL